MKERPHRIQSLFSSHHLQYWQSEQTPEIFPGGDPQDTTVPPQMGCLSSKGHLSGGVWHETACYPWCLFIVCITVILAYSSKELYLPVKVESLQQLYPALSGRHTVWRIRLHHLRAHRHTYKHQQGSDGKPAPEPRMYTHSKHLLQVTVGDTQNRGYKNGNTALLVI